MSGVPAVVEHATAKVPADLSLAVVAGTAQMGNERSD